MSRAGFIDLRSDTVTQPTDAMRQAMSQAEVGDDGYGEDPTVGRLEALFAARIGKEAAMFVPSGTMGNQIAVRLLGRAGTNIVVGRRQHVVAHERGATGMNAPVQVHPVDDVGGVLSVDDVRAAIDAAEHHYPEVSAVFVENTHIGSGGTAWTDDALAPIAALGKPVHLDGARLFNASVATGRPAAALAAPATTVMCCLSKGLAAPVGSLLAGPTPLMHQGRLERKRLGGAMRQAGIIAAAGIVALETMIERLADDHVRARRLADAVFRRWPDSGLDPESVRTNVVIFRHADPAGVLGHLHDQGILAGTIAPGIIRLVTHLDVDDDAIDRSVAALKGAP
jgi:threonine aldolase